MSKHCPGAPCAIIKDDSRWPLDVGEAAVVDPSTVREQSRSIIIELSGTCGVAVFEVLLKDKEHRMGEAADKLDKCKATRDAVQQPLSAFLEMDAQEKQEAVKRVFQQAAPSDQPAQPVAAPQEEGKEDGKQQKDQQPEWREFARLTGEAAGQAAASVAQKAVPAGDEKEEHADQWR
eukprot:gene20729-17654_t